MGVASGFSGLLGLVIRRCRGSSSPSQLSHLGTGPPAGSMPRAVVGRSEPAPMAAFAIPTFATTDGSGRRYPLLLGKERGSRPLGAGLQAFIIGSSMERFMAVLGPLRGLDFNDEGWDCLLWAVQSGHLAKVQYLVTWPGHSPHKPFGTKFELAVVEAIRLRRWDMVQYLFGLHQWTRGDGVPVRARVADVGFVTTIGLMVACRNGDLATVELFYRTIQQSELDQQHPHHRRNALVYACRSGKADLVSFLLRQGHITAEVAGVEGSRNCFMCTNGYRPTHRRRPGSLGVARAPAGPRALGRGLLHPVRAGLPPEDLPAAPFLLARSLEGVADPLEASVRDEWEAGCIPRRPSAKTKPAMWGAIESITPEQAEFALEQTRKRCQGRLAEESGWL
ncbi:hypothetical protein PG996_015057 [Apiospora saccharicola]|uniref:Ankyrin repeat protein n=1 Tax=Apiospora saccharicola TaxID=335842 RepID=A0ABR1TK24_9PEZI